MKPILCVGELLIDVIPGSSIRLGEPCYTPYPGGAPANAAVAIARLGGSARFLGAVSDDEFGRLLMEVLVSNRVDHRYVLVTKGAPTAFTLVTLCADGQRHFTFFRDQTADTRLQASDLNWDAWQGIAACHVGGVLLSTEPARSATLAAMDYTRQMRAIVSFDVNIRPTLWTSAAAIRDTITATIERADILKLSAEEAGFLRPQSGSEPVSLDEKSRLNTIGMELLQRGPRLVIITLGSRGALLLTASHQIAIPPLPIRPLDTTGAGDAFIGAILYSLARQGCSVPPDLSSLSKQDLRNLGRFANRVAGLSVTRYGGISSFPSLREVNSFSPAQEES